MGNPTIEKQGPLFSTSLTGKTQANGAIEFDCRATSRFISEGPLSHWQIQIQVSATPSAGSIAVAVKGQGASAYATLSGSIDMVNGPWIRTFDGVIDYLKLTPISFDADKTYDAIITAWR